MLEGAWVEHLPKRAPQHSAALAARASQHISFLAAPSPTLPTCSQALISPAKPNQPAFLLLQQKE